MPRLVDLLYGAKRDTKVLFQQIGSPEEDADPPALPETPVEETGHERSPALTAPISSLGMHPVDPDEVSDFFLFIASIEASLYTGFSGQRYDRRYDDQKTYVEHVLEYHLGAGWKDIFLGAANALLERACSELGEKMVQRIVSISKHHSMSDQGAVIGAFLARTTDRKTPSVVEILRGAVDERTLADIERSLSAEPSRTVFRDPLWDALEERYGSGRNPAGSYALRELYKTIQDSTKAMAAGPSSTWLAGWDRYGSPYFVTAQHVIESSVGDRADVLLRNGQIVSGRVVAAAPMSNGDYAVILIDRATEESLGFIRGEMIPLKTAEGSLPVYVISGYHDEVVIVGASREEKNPFGLSSPGNVTVITTSGTARSGYSGGPVLDEHGRVVGITYAGRGKDAWVSPALVAALKKLDLNAEPFFSTGEGAGGGGGSSW